MDYSLPIPVRHLERTLKAFMALTVKTDSATYVEIGAHRGRSIGTIGNLIKDKADKIHIIGYDIFNGNTDASFHAAEDNGKGAGNIIKCRRNLDKLCKRNTHVTYQLVEGYTIDTLTPTKATWAYIDGGHSYETVKWDHQQLKDCDVIVFDDADLQGVSKYLWEIKDQWELFDLESKYESPARQVAIINNREDYDFSISGLIPFQGVSPEEWRITR